MARRIRIGCAPGYRSCRSAMVSGSGRGAVASLVVSAAAAACCWLAVPAMAHQWYPKTCCNDQDCFPADRVQRRGDGALEIDAWPVRVIVPPGFEARASRDNRVHVCVWRDGMGQYHARCLFLPGIG